MPTFKPKYGSNGTFYDGDILVTILECSFLGGLFLEGQNSVHKEKT